MSKSIKKIVGVAAAIAVPFAAPALASSLGVTAGLGSLGVTGAAASTIGAGLTGAALGAVNAKLTGGDVGQGALFGGLGGGLSGYGGYESVAAGGPAGGTSASGLQQPLGPAQAPPLPGAEAATVANAPSFGQKIARTLTDPQFYAQATLLAASQAPDLTGLTAEEADLVAQRKAELDGLAATNRALFDEQLSNARAYMTRAGQQGPNPQREFAETKIAAQRQLDEFTRGKTGAAADVAGRQAAIQSTIAGSAAAAAEQERGRLAQDALYARGLAALPTSAPEGAAGLKMGLYDDLADRRRQAQSDFTYGVGGLLAPTGLLGEYYDPNKDKDKDDEDETDPSGIYGNT